MSEGRPAQPGVVAPLFPTTWRNVVDQAAQLSACFAGGQAKGGYVPLNLPGGQLGAAMYMYSSDSNWNILTMNTYMSSGIPVLPHTQPNQLGMSSNGSSSSQFGLLSNASVLTGTSLGASTISIKPFALGELVLQDET
ncbi:hypothetical protein HO173_009285 [Letharia columbiana]|uniref:Uncharacterized protein n=1 Tax=Letharia columbiana TaxID=112416 RepID=A0A8H6FQ38_9LECA|nr:uncharacterized protein HO173_009285 [Letharia columbiana]KAF6232617.1 hypothetical protein HO173_009285 [Letharia columbiana]